MKGERESYLLDRSRAVLTAAETEPEGDLKDALLHRVRLLQEEAIRLQMERIQRENVERMTAWLARSWGNQ